MIRRIILENYMAHVRTVIEPADGLTVLAGPNNCGKSAVVDAIETLCRNAVGDYMVRHGADEASVTIETEDGHEVRWARRSGTVRYEIDGRAVHRVGRGVPADLHEKLRLPAVEAGNESVEIHFGMQRAPVFLLDMSDGKKARFFASASDASYLLAMQREHAVRVRGRHAERRRLKRERRRLDAAVEILDGVDDLGDAADDVRNAHDALLRDRARMNELTRLIAALESAAQTVDRATETADVLARLASPPAMADDAGLAAVIAGIDRHRTAVARLADVDAALAPLASPPAVAPTVPLAALVDGLRSTRDQLDRTTERRRVLRALEPAPGIDDDLPLRAMIRTLESLDRDVADARRRGVEIAASLDAVRADAERWSEAHPHCPTCGATVDAAHLLEAHGAAGENDE